MLHQLYFLVNLNDDVCCDFGELIQETMSPVRVNSSTVIPPEIIPQLYFYQKHHAYICRTHTTFIGLLFHNAYHYVIRNPSLSETLHL